MTAAAEPPTGPVTVTLIAAVARNGVIGLGGEIPWRLVGEQARLKALTMGHVLVMGRLTYESIGRPLPGRTTVVVTRQRDWQPSPEHAAAVLVAGSVEAGLRLAAEVDPQIFVLGGAQLYAATLASADVLELSWVEAEPEGDTLFPAVRWESWVEVSREPHQGWSAVRYERRQEIVKQTL